PVQLLPFLASVCIIAAVLWDAFETVVLPRSVGRRVRLTRVYFRVIWKPWRRLAGFVTNESRRERFLAVFGPLSLLGLAALWAFGLLVGFAGVQWATGSHLRPVRTNAPFIDDFYLSGTTFFTLGLGDVQPQGDFARMITVAECGTGFAFLALVIAY